jgi:phosphate transport system protein
VLTAAFVIVRRVMEAADVPQTRSAFTEELRLLEVQTLDALDLVATTLERALQALRHGDLDLARVVVADDDALDDRYVDVNGRVITLLATEAPVATDLRLAMSLVHVIGHAERMGDQCVNLAKMILLTGGEKMTDPPLLDGVQRMGALAVREIRQAKHAFALRDPSLAADLVHKQGVLTRADREVFLLAARGETDELRRAWALSMVLVARALSRIGDNAVDIGEQAAFVTTGRMCWFPTAPARGGAAT